MYYFGYGSNLRAGFVTENLIPSAKFVQNFQLVLDDPAQDCALLGFWVAVAQGAIYGFRIYDR